MVKQINSKKAFETAKELMPGGVNSPVRAFQSVGMAPLFMSSGQGSKIKDVDGNTYIDYVLSWGPLILGHAHRKVVEAIQKAALAGTSFGMGTQIENELAQAVQERIPSIEKIRMVNSGTEATMSALRLARGYTGRNIIVKFQGNYHGHSDSLLIKAGSGIATLGLPDSPGVPREVAKNTITVAYNDISTLEQVFQTYGKDIAAIIVEPVSGNMGVVPPKREFLPFLREITSDYGSLLIMDEVMTGFRVGYHSAQGHFGIQPDLTCLGKIIGGGLPVGAFGGRADIMNRIAPSGPVYQAGTLSGNPLSMTAGLETLKHLTEPDYDMMNLKIDRLIQGYKAAAEKYQIPLQINRVGAMFGVFFTDVPVTNFEAAQKADTERFATYYRGMIEAGIFLPPSQFEGVFLSTAHTDNDIEETIQAVNKVFKEISEKDE